MEVIVYQKNEKWGIEVSSTVGASIGRTMYESKEEAIAEARRQYPEEEIKIRK